MHVVLERGTAGDIHHNEHETMHTRRIWLRAVERSRAGFTGALKGNSGTHDFPDFRKAFLLLYEDKDKRGYLSYMQQ